MTTTLPPADTATRPPERRRSFRTLDRYPSDGRRYFYLGIVVLATVVLYYELYVQGAVATPIITYFGMDLRFFVFASIVGNLIGALASLAAGLGDRIGRANMLIAGLFVTGVLILFGLPNAANKVVYLVLFAIVSLVEGMALVATPALVRDFSPQVGRATAMGFWTLGPVLGSLVVTSVSSSTLNAHPDWRFQFYVCGVAGLVVFVIALVFLRELAPPLRDQIVVTARERALVDARAAGIDAEAAERRGWRSLMRLDILGSAVAISVFLIFYYIAVGFLVVYFAVNFGYSPQRANALANWYWIGNAVTLVIAGFLSDRLRVRKPFMVVGALLSAAGVAWFAIQTTDRTTGYYTFAVIFLLIAVGGGIAYSAWMAAYTETVERQNPAATARGLAVYGGTIRGFVTLLLIALTFSTGATGVVVDHGPRVQELSTTYAAEITTLGKLKPATVAQLTLDPDSATAQAEAVSELARVPVSDVARAQTLTTTYAEQLKTIAAIAPATLQKLLANPTDLAAAAAAVGDIVQKLGVSPTEAQTRLLAAAQVPAADLAFLAETGPKLTAAAAQLSALSKVPAADGAYLLRWGPAVQQAQIDAPGQWQVFFWIAFGGAIFFIVMVFFMAGRWSPRRARKDAEAHRAAVDRELAALPSSG